ncbi:HAMP domain-containing methyl-accepting chemotaxis protein [Rheinheimera sp. UJ63]|uniref:HAMP domain-containing methyl-accepting chemotaxis protein n=1 Tax=Rheinheimera sp. UJ63 TaxID=2910157 RepID=UPI001F1E25E9|nr:methyl-accepting chemotaxis protein [Rheinheimera sp. UJ63]MCF4007836.1 methyl-accepting chemotaxis protein [Rheinheimera sp. UJ63]
MWVTTLFLNLSVSKKLIGGFSIVLLILLGISIVSYQSMVSIVERFALVNQVSQIDTLVNTARMQEKEFIIRQDGSAANLNKETINQVIALAELAANEFSTLESKQLIADLKQSARAYQTSFLQFEGLTAANLQRQNEMELAARNTVEMLNQIEQQLNQQTYQLIAQNADETQRASLQLSSLAGNAAKVMLTARKDEKNFVMRQDTADAEILQAHIDNLQGKIQQLRTSVTDSDLSQQLQAITLQLNRYQQQFDAYQASIDNGKETESAMREHARLTMQYATDSASRQMVRLESMAQTREILVIVTAIIALLLGFSIAALITRAIVSPLRQVVTVANKIADGDLTEDLPQDRHDELGQLMQATQKMTENLRGIISQLAAGISQLASSTEQMAAVSTQNSAGASQQRAETEQAATAMNQMAATVQDVAQSAEDASNTANTSAEQATLSERVIKTAMQQINDLVTEVQDSSETIDSLMQQTSNIGTILDVIKGVAEQTNLLALNAAIEAARAGDAGRGFAVVADEVRNLAFRTKESTVQIENLISTLQQKASAATASMARSNALANTTKESAHQASNSIETITAAIGSIQQMNHQIAAAALEQSTVAEEINRNINRIKDIAEQTASASEETAAASSDLSQLGVELHGIASRFRVHKDQPQTQPSAEPAVQSRSLRILLNG